MNKRSKEHSRTKDTVTLSWPKFPAAVNRGTRMTSSKVMKMYIGKDTFELLEPWVLNSPGTNWYYSSASRISSGKVFLSTHFVLVSVKAPIDLTARNVWPPNIEFILGNFI
jgi:hypothetical protein